MTFFSRPDLSNLQFKQLNDSTLTLSGQTQIATTSGLTLIGSTGGTPQYIPIVATGATNDFVLTYDGGENVIKLKQSTASGGTGTYPYPESATTTVGGLPTGQDLYNEQVVDILHDILVPTLYPTLTNPSLSSFTIDPTTSLYEIGTIITVTGTTGFNAGYINPQYTALSDYRSDGVSGYTYINFGITTYESSPTKTFGGIINSSSTELSSTICYSGGTQPKDSSGANYDSPLSAGSTSPATKTICGVYPWFWGTDAVAPDVSTSGCTQCLIDSYTTKCVENSNGSIYVNNFNVSGEYIWFAIPSASIAKTCWQGANNVSNNGIIPGSLFPTGCDSVVDSPHIPSCWTTISYSFYVSNYATDINYGMTFCN